MKWALLVIPLITLMLIFSMPFTYSQFEGLTYWNTPSDYIKYSDNRELLVKDIPRFCFYEPEKGVNAFSSDSLFRFSADLISHWIGLLDDKSNNFSGVWDIELQRIPIGEDMKYHFEECDLHMFWLGPPPLDIETGNYYKGGVSRTVGTSVEHKMVMFTYDYFPNGTKDGIPVYEAKPTEQIILETTFLHEIGHVFGLGHHKWYDKYDWGDESYDGKHADRSIMYKLNLRTGDEQKTITDFDVNAIIAKYGTDGWGGDTNWKPLSYEERN